MRAGTVAAVRIPATCNVPAVLACHAESVSLRTLIVDDNRSFLAAAQAVLDGPEVRVIGVASSGFEALGQLGELKPDVVLLDIDLGDESGFTLAEQISERLDGACPKLILISAHPEDEFAELIAESPAVGFISKSDLSAAAVVELLGETRHG